MYETERNQPDALYNDCIMLPEIKAGLFVILVFLTVFLLAGCEQKHSAEESRIPASQTEKPEAGQTETKTIVAIGNSLTAGLDVDENMAYPSLLEKKLLSDGYAFTVVNAGISGETSSGTLSRIDWVISSLSPDIAILVTGANDGLRGIDPGLMRSNLDQIITLLKKKRIPLIMGGMKMLTNLGPEYVRAFENVYPELARKHNVTLIPFFLEGVAGEPHLNQADGIHPNADGYGVLVDNIYPYVLKTVQQVKIENGDNPK